MRRNAETCTTFSMSPQHVNDDAVKMKIAAAFLSEKIHRLIHSNAPFLDLYGWLVDAAVDILWSISAISFPANAGHTPPFYGDTAQ